MPGLEDNSKSITPSEDAEDVEPEQPAAARELTQTDRINRQLLKSFLERINTNGIMEPNFYNASGQNNSHADGFEE